MRGQTDTFDQQSRNDVSSKLISKTEVKRATTRYRPSVEMTPLKTTPYTDSTSTFVQRR